MNKRGFATLEILLIAAVLLTLLYLQLRPKPHSTISASPPTIEAQAMSAVQPSVGGGSEARATVEAVQKDLDASSKKIQQNFDETLKDTQ